MFSPTYVASANADHVRTLYHPAPRVAPQKRHILCKYFNKISGCLANECMYEHIPIRCAFYVSKGGCEKGNNCRWRHTDNENIPFPRNGGGYTFTKPDIRPCSETDCGNMCIGKRCRSCYYTNGRRALINDDAVFDVKTTKGISKDEATKIILDKGIKIMLSSLTALYNKNSDIVHACLNKWIENHPPSKCEKKECHSPK